MDVVWLEHPRSCEVSYVGGKAASLGQLAAGFRVPPAFALTVDAFDRWSGVRRNGTGPLPPDFVDAVSTAYRELASRCDVDTPAVAVRSSAVDEDGSDASFAGQHDTFLNVLGASEVAGAVVRCWASLDSETALEYRRRSGLDVDGARMGVVVQQMVPADISGVAFSANPVTGALEEIVINSAWGLGESVVSGTVTPDTYVVEKSGSRVISRQVSDKAVMTVAKGDGTREVDVPRIMRAQPSMSDDQARSVARLAADLERKMGHPVDVEWAVYRDTTYLLQCRPITTLG